MKKIKFIVFLVLITAPVFCQETEQINPVEFIKLNWVALLAALLVFIEVIVRLTPTQNDDKWFGWLKNLIDWLVPSLKKGGGIFKKAAKN